MPAIWLRLAKFDTNKPHETFSEIERNVRAQMFGLLAGKSDGAFKQLTESIIHGVGSGEVPRTERYSRSVVPHCGIQFDVLPRSELFIQIRPGSGPPP